ncbi:hypothetical protein Dimus_024346, partial [Dionaea muscipula]
AVAVYAVTYMLFLSVMFMHLRQTKHKSTKSEKSVANSEASLQAQQRTTTTNYSLRGLPLANPRFTTVMNSTTNNESDAKFGKFHHLRCFYFDFICF